MGFAQLLESLGLDLTDTLAGQVENLADLFEGDATAIGDVEGTGLTEFPDLEAREVEFDGAGARIDVEIEVVFAGDVGAGALALAALAAHGGAVFLNGLKEVLELNSFFLGELFFGNGLASTQIFASAPLIGCGPPFFLFGHGRRMPRGVQLNRRVGHMAIVGCRRQCCQRKGQ